LATESGIASRVSIQPLFISFKSDYRFVHFSALYPFSLAVEMPNCRSSGWQDEASLQPKWLGSSLFFTRA
jgi:hypothetical protein